MKIRHFVATMISFTAIACGTIAPPQAATPNQEKPTVSSVDKFTPTWGARPAMVVVTILGDLDSPAVGAHEAVLAALRSQMDPDKLEIVWKHAPTTARGRQLAEYAQGILETNGRAAFWDFVTVVSRDLTRAEPGTLAARIRIVDRDAIEKGRRDQSYAAHVAKSNSSVSGKKAVFWINDRAVGVAGSDTEGDIVTMVDREMKRVEAKMSAGLSRDNARKPEENEASLASAEEGPRTLAGGLRIKDTRAGAGPTVQVGDTIMVHYRGRLVDGTEFDNSYNRNVPLTVTIGKHQVIEGWERGLVGMRKGGTRELTIPGPLAYGERGSPPRIPPNATLVFEVELVGIK